MEILYKELSYQIIGCFFDVFREIGPGYDEYTYHQALNVRFEKECVQFKSKFPLQVYYHDFKIADLEPDFIIEDKVVLELKAIQTEFLPVNYTQIITYLRATNKRLAYHAEIYREAMKVELRLNDFMICPSYYCTV